MSTLYNLEPQPTAKVLLKTTSGDIVLEIFAKQTPLASRNFLQHCLDGYYDNTIFHRLVPGFIIQGGDPTGLGTGGVSALDSGGPFADEFHTRLRFNRRGLLGMANSGEANDNTSQFFLTLDKTPELQGKNTMFGRVEGDTIYNLMKMGDADLADGGSDRPLYPTKVTASEVLVNPFDDMVKRVMVAERTQGDDVKAGKKKRKAGKTLLSFGADEGDDAAPVIKKAKVNPTFTSADPAIRVKEEALKSQAKSKSVKAAPPRRRSPSPSTSASPPPAAATAPAPKAKSPTPPPSPAPLTQLDRTNAQIAALKASMKRTTGTAQTAPQKKQSALEAMIPATATRGRRRGKAKDEPGAMDFLTSFKQRLGAMQPALGAAVNTEPGAEEEERAAAASTTTSALEGGGEEKLCDLHFIANCQSCRSWEDDNAGMGGDGVVDDDNDVDWMAHELSFAKDTLGKDLEWKRKMEQFEVIDSRDVKGEREWERKRERKREQQEGSLGGGGVGVGGREWDRTGNKERGAKTRS